MRRLQEGDNDAYRQIYERWRRPLFLFLVRRTCALDAAEDAHQEAWMRVYQCRHKYDPKRPFRPWLYTLAANAGRDARRPDPRALHMDLEEVAPYSSADPLVLRDLLLFALHCLEGVDRRILLLVVEGFTTSEIAEMLAMGDGAVRMRLSRARERIQEALDV